MYVVDLLPETKKQKGRKIRVIVQIITHMPVSLLLPMVIKIQDLMIGT